MGFFLGLDLLQIFGNKIPMKLESQNAFLTTSIQKLKDHDLRVTEARRELLKVLIESSKSLSIKDLHEALAHKSVDLASVYRNLSVFERVGLVHQLIEGQYKICDHSSCQRHAHVITECEKCHKVEEPVTYNSKDLRLIHQLSQLTPHLKRTHLVTLMGVCKKCEALL